MYIPKYDGNIHPDEWINDIHNYYRKENIEENEYLHYAIPLVDPIIKLPSRINSFEKLCSALKDDISFTVFKNTNLRKLRLLKYVPEREGGETSKFISNFRKLCYNAEINDIEKQNKYLLLSLPNDYFITEFLWRNKNIKTMNELIKEFEEIVMDDSNLIRNGSIVALKHVSTRKYLSSINNSFYKTGSKSQLVFANNLLDSNALWKITFASCKELASYTENYISLLHKNSNIFLGVNENNISPFINRKLADCLGYLKSNDVIYLSINQVYLRSHDFHFTIGFDTFQEVACHSEIQYNYNYEWCIELIK
ncbi:11886_t:CDS:2 [Funneliformis caledonium]|uniref:11886_t:CDS:1 n=1 Tax=Funneliformis caledonium TaxID=1117310 RepID=A0A9N9B8C1_9GLOM|nr:11886_t:CDS:2 [Funneliformis caledonium]